MDHAGLADSELGRSSDYPQTYAPEVLFPVDRQTNRAQLGLDHWPWAGADRWYAYELSWLNPDGLPQVAMAAFDVPADSPCIIESKSLKLYLNSLNMTVFEDRARLAECLEQDLSRVAQAQVVVNLFDVEATLSAPALEDAVLIDDQAIRVTEYDLNSDLLRLKPGGGSVRETLYSHLLRSNCPVTGQPDWGSLVVDYAGPALDREALLRYVVSFRSHTEFHEHCVERVFTDLKRLGDYSRLVVRAHYVRRGGLDINPWRSLHNEPPPLGRFARQ